MKNKRVLAFDFGASSGRAMIADITDGKLNIKEIHRFSNDPVNIGGNLYWDVLKLFHEIKQGIVLAVQDGGFDSIGIDTWGVDFGLLDKHGELLGNPFNNRDKRTIGIPEEVYKIIPRDVLYKRTGIQENNFNTIFQLYSMCKNRPETVEAAETLLLMPDLFAYFLTGKKRMEYTIASTAGILNPKTKKPDTELLKMLGIKTSLLPEIIMPGEAYGNLSDEICDELHCESVPVFAVATHDTASAVASVPTAEKDYAYISCGTWSLFGTVTDEPILTEKSNAAGFTNEGASDGKIRYLRNIMGLWLIQQSRAEWKRRGLNVSFDEMEKQARQAKPFACFINPDDIVFSAPGNMPDRVVDYCKKTGQYVPQNMGEILRCIYESLAYKYKNSIEGLSAVTGKEYNILHMVGGGIKDNLLCQMAANSCGVPVYAGPVEATVTGNVIVQFMAHGILKNLADARELVMSGTDIKIYEPSQSDEWQANYEKYLKTVG